MNPQTNLVVRATLQYEEDNKVMDIHSYVRSGEATVRVVRVVGLYDVEVYKDAPHRAIFLPWNSKRRVPVPMSVLPDDVLREIKRPWPELYS
jgi:hypothetical protein